MAATPMTTQQILTFLFFAMAVSFDGLAAGMSYGMRQIHIPLVPLLLVNMVSAFAVALSMIMGAWLSQWLSFSLARAIGGVIFIGLGLNQLWQARRSLNTEKSMQPQEEQLPSPHALHLHIGRVNLIVQIYRDPPHADMDRSGFLSPVEAMLLGIALALDALAAGIGAAFAGYSTIWTPLAVGITQTLFIAGGVGLGRHFNEGAHQASLKRIGTVFPGAVLIVLGFLRFLA
jgi:putative sporulation protein YtaF